MAQPRPLPRTPEVPGRRPRLGSTFLRCLLCAALGYAIGMAAPGQPAPRVELGAVLDGPHASVWAGPGGVWSGRWEMGAPASVAWSPDGLDWQSHHATMGGNWESVSGGMWMDDTWHLTTESPDGPAVLRLEGQALSEVARFDGGMLYAFPAEGAVVVGSGHRRDIGGRLAVWNGSSYELRYGEMRDEAGRALMPWGALRHQRGWIVPAAWAGAYNAAGAGRVLVGGDGGWAVAPLRADGVIQVARLGDSWAATTCRGEIWTAPDPLGEWSLAWAGPRADIRILGKWLVSAAGRVYRGLSAEPVATIDNCTTLSLVERDGALVGTAEIGGAWRGVRITEAAK